MEVKKNETCQWTFIFGGVLRYEHLGEIASGVLRPEGHVRDGQVGGHSLRAQERVYVGDDARDGGLEEARDDVEEASRHVMEEGVDVLCHIMDDVVMGGHPIRDAHHADGRIMLMPRFQHTQLMLMLMQSISIALSGHDVMPKNDLAHDLLRLHEAVVDELAGDECYGHPTRCQFLGQVHERVDVTLARVRHH
mgnify:CR=1 FL=1